MPRENQLEVDRACVLMVDVQEKLLQLIADRQRILNACRKLLDGVRIFELPVLATEQYPHGLGSTDESLQLGLEATHATVVEKPTFSCWAHPAVRDAAWLVLQTRGGAGVAREIVESVVAFVAPFAAPDLDC